MDDIHALEASVIRILVDSYCCSDKSIRELDLSGFPCVKELKIGGFAFMYVNELKLDGLKELESVEIGKNSFTHCKGGNDNDPNRHFYLKNCPKIRSLKIGRFSFLDYSVCMIENVPSLEVIELGDVSRDSANFAEASLELRSCFILNPISGRYAVSQDCGHWACNNACAKTCCI